MTSEPLLRLLVRRDGQELRTVSLDARPLTLGRSPDNRLQLDDLLVSRQHAELRADPEGLLLTDLGSTRGTFVAGERLRAQQPQRLTPGMSFQIGPYELIVIADLGAPVAHEPSADPVAVAGPELAVVARPSGPPPPPDPRLPRLLEGLPSQEPYLPTRDQPSRYLAWLPMIFHDQDLLRRYLLIFEAIWEPLEQRQDHIEYYFNPLTCPVTLLPWIASWFGHELNPHWPEGRRRQVLAAIFELYRWRGTRHGLTRMLTLCTGLEVELDDATTPFVVQVKVRVPPGITFERDFLIELIEAHKPAHAGYTIEVG